MSPCVAEKQLTFTDVIIIVKFVVTSRESAQIRTIPRCEARVFHSSRTFLLAPGATSKTISIEK